MKFSCFRVFPGSADALVNVRWENKVLFDCLLT